MLSKFSNGTDAPDASLKEGRHQLAKCRRKSKSASVLAMVSVLVKKIMELYLHNLSSLYAGIF